MNYPKRILNNILWGFYHDRFLTQSAFELALIEYNESINKRNFSVNLAEIILYSPQVVIQYSYWDEESDDIVEPDILLESGNKVGFTSGELLFKVHNEVCEKLQNEDHKFLEGLSLWEGEHPNYPNIPLYFLLQGS